MKQVQSPHPRVEQLAAFCQGRLSPAEQARVEGHIAQCDTCCQALKAVPDDTLVEKLWHPNTSSGVPTAPYPAGAVATAVPPELVGHTRYRILKVLGTGGMGVVYQALHTI